MTRKSVAVFCTFFSLTMLVSIPLSAQMITGVWKGKIGRQKVELKIIQKGDSLVGTSYYYESPGNYRRYSITGYFDPATNAAVWWDDQLIEERSGKLSIGSPGKIPMLSRADFNCPGSGRMMLDGKASEKENELLVKGDVHLDKTDRTTFEDEWDFVIDNYTVGANDPDIIDSIALVSFQEPVPPGTVTIVKRPADNNKRETINDPKDPADKPVINVPIEQKFIAREKKFIKEIPVSGDSIELRFYDNAEIDGDSISLFLNDKLLFEHIRLTGNAWIIKISLNDLKETNELTMVAENLGSIPPNTAYMVAIVNEKRYDAYLASSEGSSAMIRLSKK
jgi:hypothetical protein